MNSNSTMPTFDIDEQHHVLKASLYLDSIPEDHHDRAVDAVLQRDAAGFLLCASSTASLKLVYCNRKALIHHGIYEAALIHSMITGTNNAHFPLKLLKQLIASGDPAKLLAAGDPLPHGGPFTLFRGVAGRGRLRRVHGIHWTGDRSRAEWFAKLYGLPDPAVYKAIVPARHIVAHVNDRGEDEYIAVIPRSLNLVRLGAGAEAALI
jgi:hypothetical protein